MTVAAKFLPADHLQHEVRTGDALHVRVTLMMANPYCWHAIRSYECCIGEDPGEGGITLTLHDSVNTGEAYIPFALGLQVLFDSRKRLLEADRVDCEAEDVCFGMLR